MEERSQPEGPFGAMSPEMAADPQALYTMMRDGDPVMPVGGSGVVIANREVIDEALRRPDVFSSNMSAVDLKNVRPLIPLQIDPPDHKKYRKILDPLFAPREVAHMEGPVAELVNDLIDGFVDRGEVDFAQEFSVPFPSQVFLTLLGLPLDDLTLFLKMKDGIIRPQMATQGRYGDEACDAYQRESAEAIYAYFDTMLDQRQAEGRDDLLTRFLHTKVEGRRLTREDILDICFLFLIAGLDTVTATLDCMFAYLARHPERRRQIVADPSLIPAAVEELLRWETPVMAVVRVALEDTTLGGCPVQGGQQVIALLGAANSDEAEFPDAPDVRFDREANRHIAFGGGIHRCLGSHLARLELRVALREWHRRIPDYAIPKGADLRYTPGIRSIEHFPLVFTST